MLAKVGQTLSIYQWTLLALGILFAVRFLYIPISDLALFYDEAYYHFWSQNFDWGYYSKPPMVAWLISLTSGALHSVDEWAIKIAAPILYAATAFLIYSLGTELYPKKVALVAAIIFSTTPLVAFNSLFITTDAPLLFYWALTSYLFVRALKTNHIVIWLLAGLAGGFGLLSKYTMIFLLFGFLIYLLSHKERRKVFCSSGIWLAMLVAVVVFSPNLVWNYNHDFISFQHTSEISQLDKHLFHPEKFFEFFAGQFLVFGPITMWILLRYSLHFTPNPELKTKASNHLDVNWLLICIGAPIFLVICSQALLSHAHVNWAVPTYVSASLLVAYQLLQSNSRKFLLTAIGINLLIGALFYAYQPLQQAVGIEAKRSNNPFHRVSGWREIIQQIASHPATRGNRIWLSDSRKLLSYLSYYHVTQIGTDDYLLSFKLDDHVHHHFDLKFDISDLNLKLDLATQSLIYLSESEWDYSGCFDSVTEIAALSEPVYATLTRTVYLYEMTGFKGYEHCHKNH